MSSIRGLRACIVPLALTLALMGCKKDEAETTQKKTALEASAQPAAAAKAGEAPAAPAAKASAVKAPSSPGEAPVVSRIKLPDDVVAALAFRSLDSVLNSAKTTIEVLDPANAQPGFISAAKEGIKESLGWKNIAWIQPDKPIRSMLFNAKAYEGKAQFLALPMTSKDDVLAALPDGARQKDGAHVAKYDNNGQTVFVDFIEGHAIYTDHESFFEKGKAFFEANLASWAPSRDVELKLDLDNIYALFLPELSEAKRQLLASYASEPGGEATGLERLLAFEVETLFSLFESSHQADLNLWLDGKTFNISAAFLPKAETALDTFRKVNANRRSKLAKFIPKTGMVNSVINIDFRTLSATMKAIDQVTMESYKDIADLRPEDIKVIEEQLKMMGNQASGEAIISLYTDGEFPAAFVAAAQLEDPKKIQSAYGVIFDTLIPRVIAKLSAEEGAALPAELAKAKTLKDLLPLLNQVGGPLGVKMSAVEKEADGVSLVGFKVNMDWDRFAAATELDKADPALFKTLKGILGNQFEAVLGTNQAGKLGAVTFGPKAIAANKAVLLGTEFGGGESGIVRAAPDNVGVASIRLETLLKSISFIPGLAEKRELIKKIPAERPIIATLDADETKVDIQLSLPVDVMQVMGDIQK